jgi:hypothetical protein
MAHNYLFYILVPGQESQVNFKLTECLKTRGRTPTFHQQLETSLSKQSDHHRCAADDGGLDSAWRRLNDLEL